MATVIDTQRSRPLPFGPLGRVPELDGLRGIAILLVLGIHIAGTLFEGGGSGVDLFFVLSGFLITKLAYEEHDRNAEFALRSFYTRRFFRLQPALLLLLIILFVASLSYLDDIGATIREEIAFTALLSGNLWPLVNGGDPREILGHSWSLGVEEQFYLAWPFVLVTVASAFRDPARFVRALLGFVLVVETLGRVLVAGVLDYEHWSAVPLWGFEGLLLGCVLAVWLHSGTMRATAPSPHPIAFAAVVGFIAVDLFLANTIWAWDDFDLRSPALRLGFTYVVYCVVAFPTWGWNSLLRNRLLAWFGKVSYSLYLWHIPVIVVLNREMVDQARPVRFAAQFAVSLLFASGSYYLVEGPILARYRAWARARTDA